ncbi:NAD(P)H-binding protein [Erythrobacter sp. BLCC-B19]|uniref:NAD(P)H-binding protein n=1 Tax=Erythrobacter sp. BLCC-B19 TaxID=3025315 RepID=UPI0023616E88|nr:NAD(P)H-binding protein [Erythrobacter sp. BLCC-B19]WDA40065.1 NAD(P)H-binding protein [Erythrobacter sp. BLCC-B19]
MSDPRAFGPVRVALVGATGLIGRRVIEIASQTDDVRLVGIARREAPLPPGARMEMFVSDPSKWGEVLDAVRPRALICALGTTWKKAGRDEAAFRAVDQELVLATAEAAKRAGVPNMVVVSAAGANSRAKALYMRVKGETEEALSRIGFKRLDILHPGLLRGERVDDLRFAERAAIIAAPLIDPLLSGSWERFRSIDAELVAEAALGLALRRAGGRFTHDNEAMRRAAREWRKVAAGAGEAA